jgi:nucleoid-associated protein YgaU
MLIIGTAALLGWAIGSPAGTWRGLVTAVNPSGATSDFDQLLVCSAALAAWVGLSWVCLATCLELASALPGAAGTGFAAVAARVTPAVVRRLVQAAIGLTVLAGPLTAGSALASGPSTTTPATTSTTTTTTTSVDRPDSAANSALPPTPPGTAPQPLTLDRPAGAFVPSAPPLTVKRTPTGPAALVTGVPLRDAASPTDLSTGGYVVHRGDTLWDIAARHLGPGATAVDISRDWPAWYDANRAVIGEDPSLIRPGELLFPPATPTSHVGTR